LITEYRQCPGWAFERVLTDPRTEVPNQGSELIKKAIRSNNGNALGLFIEDSRFRRFLDTDFEYVWTSDFNKCLLRAFVSVVFVNPNRATMSRWFIIMLDLCKYLTVSHVEILIQYGSDDAWEKAAPMWVCYGLRYAKTLPATKLLLAQTDRIKPLVPRWVTELESDMCPDLLINTGSVPDDEWFKTAATCDLTEVVDCYLQSGRIDPYDVTSKNVLWDTVRDGSVSVVKSFVRAPTWKLGTHTMRQALTLALRLDKIAIVRFLRSKLKDHPQIIERAEGEFRAWQNRYGKL
jgi:hypothetical protein